MIVPGAYHCALQCLILLLILSSCTSRYRLELFLVEGDSRSKVKVEKSEYFVGAVLGDPLSEDKVAPGDGNCLVIVTGSRGESLGSRPEDVVSFDRYDRYRVFFELPSEIKPAAIPLKDRSFVQQLGRYDLSADDKMFFPADGRLIVDSVSGGRLFGSIEGRYENHQKASIAFEGKFKAKIAD
ncbi:MAG: hypothetical protein AB1772_06590 [Candidatus Zixiibacteriota bacterium]